MATMADVLECALSGIVKEKSPPQLSDELSRRSGALGDVKVKAKESCDEDEEGSGT